MIVFSVCDYSGNWSSPYKKAGFHVYRFDPKLPNLPSSGLFPWTVEQLINRLGYDVPERCDVLLMAPPCTDFSIACNRLWKEKDDDGRTAASLEIIDACLNLVRLLRPRVWALENPVGRLWKLRSELGKPWYFQPCDFGDAYKKKTGLVGSFTAPLPLFLGKDLSVSPENICFAALHKGGGEKRRELRSVTPLGFSNAFFQCNNLEGVS